jgi:hypothetical protein
MWNTRDTTFGWKKPLRKGMLSGERQLHKTLYLLSVLEFYTTLPATRPRKTINKDIDVWSARATSIITLTPYMWRVERPIYTESIFTSLICWTPTPLLFSVPTLLRNKTIFVAAHFLEHGRISL